MYTPVRPGRDDEAEEQDRRRRRLRDDRPRLLRRQRGRQGRRQGLGRERPDRRSAHSARSTRRRSAACPRSSTSRTAAMFLYKVLAERTQKPDAEQADTIKARRLPELVRREEGRGDRSPARCSPNSGSADPAAVLDALVAEARLRWGLDLAAGLQVVAAERLIATPLEPSRPALVVPARGAPRRRAPTPPTPPSRRRLPGRHGPGGRDAARGPRRGSTPRTTPSGGSAPPTGSTVGGARSRRPRRARSTCRRSRPRRPSRAPGRCPGSRDRLRRPDGCPWDREQTHESLRNHLLEEAYEVYDALGGGATPALAEELGDLLLQVVLHAQLAAEEGVFDLTDVNAAIASKIVRRHPHVFGDAEARTAADVNRQWERIKADERAGAAAAAGDGPTDGRTDRRARSTASAARCRRSPRARRCRSGRRTSATTGRTSRASSTRSPRRPASCRAPRPTPSGPRSSATCCSSSSTSPAGWAIEAEAALRGRRTTSSAAASRASSAWPRSGASRCATSSSRSSTSCGTRPRPKRRRHARR